MTDKNKPAKIKKTRVDQLLLDRGLVESRTKAQALIMAGKVFCGEQKVQKPGDKIAEDKPLEVRGQDHPWVSRGGLKLEKGIREFNLDAKGITAIDVGASTGGFTDVLLAHGANKVYAVDVGRGQLHWKLRTDDRVVIMESTNARTLDKTLIPDPIDAVVCDASFIGLEKVLPAGLSLIRDNGWLVALIKPQFQVGKGQVGKGGVVRDPELHKQVCREVTDWINGLPGWTVQNIAESPITGPQGNVEFLIHARYQTEQAP